MRSFARGVLLSCFFHKFNAIKYSPLFGPLLRI
jgi:hypothetical protein